MNRKRYSAEFKKEAARLLILERMSAPEVSKTLRVSANITSAHQASACRLIAPFCLPGEVHIRATFRFHFGPSNIASASSSMALFRVAIADRTPANYPGRVYLTSVADT
ncbi:MAG: hypothetical protein ACI9X0_000344 [Kiritimatiellia bacterium]|jgi:hypothetical protein